MLRIAALLLLAGTALGQFGQRRFCADYGLSTSSLCGWNARQVTAYVYANGGCRLRKGCFPLGDVFRTFGECQQRCLFPQRPTVQRPSVSAAAAFRAPQPLPPKPTKRNFNRNFRRTPPAEQCNTPSERFTSCGSACPPVCGQPPARFCTANCVVGCECAEGFIRLPGLNLKCIPERMCPDFDKKRPRKEKSEEKSVEVVDDMCSQPMDMGSCLNRAIKNQDFVKVFWFDETRGECEPFGYSGCGGNANRFRTKKECRRKCIRKNKKATEVSSEEVEEEEFENPCDEFPCPTNQRCLHRAVECVRAPCPQFRCVPRCPFVPVHPCKGRVCPAVPGAVCEQTADCRAVVFVHNGRDVTAQCGPVFG